MNCQDVAKLRTPLDAVCQTTDIGCVPIVDGKPTCSPQPDELPFAFDPKTTTLWIFSCKTREWINFTKFTMCQLEALNLDNITNICDILNIGVNYAGSGECKQGTITLAELVERIKECLELETRIITIGEGDGNKIKISIDGLPNLPPVYVQGENIWSEGGSGTETDPLIVATYDPICKWPTKTQKQVDDARVKHLGACLDGQMSRIPLPPKVCELPSINQDQVDATPDKELVACVNGEGVKVPFPPKPCEFPSINQDQVDATVNKELVACVNGENVKVPFPLKPCEYSQLTPEQVISAADKDLIACVNGENVKIPVPYNLYESSPCTAPALSLDQAQSAGMNLSLLACNNGETVRVPLYGSGFFEHNSDWVYTCVPSVNDVPRGAPSVGSGPLRLDCCDNLHVWLCDEQRWQVVRDGIEGVSQLKINQELGDEYCQDFKMKGWFGDGPCYETRWFHLNQLVKMLKNCEKGSVQCAPVAWVESHGVSPADAQGGRDCWFENNMELEKWDTNTQKSYGVSFAVWNSNTNEFEVGKGRMLTPRGDAANVGERKFTITNDGECDLWYSLNAGVELVDTAWGAYNFDFGVTAICVVNTEPNLGWYSAMKTGPGSGGSNTYHFMGTFVAKATKPHHPSAQVGGRTYYHGEFDGPWIAGNGQRRLTCSWRGVSQNNSFERLAPGAKRDFYVTTYLVFFDVKGRDKITLPKTGDDEPTIPAYHSGVSNVTVYRDILQNKPDNN